MRLGGVDLQRELNRLEEILLDSPRVPLSRRTLINEEQFLEQLDLVRLNLPSAFQEAAEIVVHKEDILQEAEQYAQEIIAAAEQRAAQILNDMGLVRQAEMEATQIRQQVQQECDTIQQQTLADIDQTRRRAQQELDEMQRRTLAECEEIQAGADDYADRVLRDMEQQLTEMMRVVRNGRQQLHSEPPAPKNLARRVPESPSRNPDRR
jgi:cell division septum initiation protein DivIVA